MKKKKTVRVFIDCEVLAIKHFSGIGHYTAELLKAVDRLLFKEEFSHFRIEIGAYRKDTHRLNRFGFDNFQVRNLPFSPHVANGLKARHRLPPIDLIYGKRVYLFPNYSCWPTLFSPVVPIIYDLSFIHYAEYVEPKNQVFLVDQVTISAKKAKQIITISKNSENEILEQFSHLKKSDISVVYPAVSTKQFYRSSPSSILRTKAKYGIFGNYILFVGNIEPRKNLIALLHAYDKLPPKLQKQYGLLLIGAKGWLDDDIQNTIIDMRIRGLQVIQPTDYVEDSDLPALYSGASVFAYVSKYEGFGIPPIEAMACGTPVISSDNSSLPEAVGDAALMVDAPDDKAIAESIERLLKDSNLAKKQTVLGYEQIKKFDWDMSARILLKTLEDAAK